MVNLYLHKVKRGFSSCCEFALEVAEVGLVAYKVFPTILGLGTLVSVSDDVP